MVATSGTVHTTWPHTMAGPRAGEHSPLETREELQVRATFPRVPQMSQSIPGKPVFPAVLRHSTEDRLTPGWHVGQPCVKAS